MRWIGNVSGSAIDREQIFQTFWHGTTGTGITTWTHRNIASTTDNGIGDVTLTFQQAYATLYAVLAGGGEGTSAGTAATLAVTTPTNSSIRFFTANTSATKINARKCSIAVAGIF